ncbi:aspartyl-phosphate phosphatase Spo0E family protein [Bacillus sp. Hm123]|uniref:aspartyl-phosphate phosphatase Spo0E family protein n=1 Tax=Bacillus sp. Hm123 TaxID=3450745 RepID=UPI003F43138C
MINGRDCKLETQKTCHHLLSQIDSKRDLMISTGIMKGLGNSETIRYSQELDQLIVHFQKNCNCWNKCL